jgi:hypothetical protein
MGAPASVLPSGGVTVSVREKKPVWLALLLGFPFVALGLLCGQVAPLMLFFGSDLGTALILGTLGAIIILCGALLAYNPSLETQKRSKLAWEIRRYKNKAELAAIREMVRTGKNAGLSSDVIVKWFVIGTLLVGIAIPFAIYVLPYVAAFAISFALIYFMCVLMFKSIGPVSRVFWSLFTLPFRILYWRLVFAGIRSLFRGR